MTTKAIVFLGLGPYYESAYIYDGEAYVTSLFPLALAQFCEPKPDQWLACVTDEAAETQYYRTLKAELQVQPVRIPWGKDSEELWQIFDRVVEAINPREQVIFDITHGFRSLPVIVLLAAAYLKAAKGIDLQGIFYAAYDVRDQSVQPHRTPVFDLTPFLTLLDWTIASDRFVHTGDGRPLARLLRQAAHFEHPRRELEPVEQAQADASKRINLAANAIEEVSRTLLTTLVPHAEKASHLLSIRLADAEADLAKQAPPYRLLAEHVRQAYAPFALETPMAGQVEIDLERQLAMIGWYVKNGHTPQAATLMREWLVTAVGYRLGVSVPQLLDHRTGRSPVEHVLGWAAHGYQLSQDRAIELPDYAEVFRGLPAADSIARYWGRLTQVRNTIDHGAMKKGWQNQSSEAIIGQVQNLYRQLGELAKHLMEPTS